MEPTFSFGAWLRRRRRSRELTQAELARRSGVAAITLRKIEADERRPSAQVAGLLARALELPPPLAARFVRAAEGALAADQIDATDATAAARDAQAQALLALAERAAPEVHGASQVEWLARLRREQEPIAAALEWLLGPERRTDPNGPRLAAALWWHWYTSGQIAVGQDWLERALSQARDPLVAVRLGYRAAALAWRQGDFAGAAALAERSLARAAGEDAGYAQGILAAALLMQGQWQRAATLALAAETKLPADAPWPRAVSQIIIGVAARESGALAAAEVALSAAQGRFALAGDRWGAALARSERGLLAAVRGDESAAAQHYAAALALASAIGDQAGAADTSLRLARLARRRGDPVTAAALLTDLIATVGALRDQANTALVLWEAAALAPQPLAAALAHAANALGTALNLPRVPFQDPELTGLLQSGPPRFATTQDALAAALALCAKFAQP